MSVFVGAGEIAAAYLGSTALSAIHVGATQVWPAGATLWTPADIQADLDLWLDAADATSITDDANGVSVWADKSNNAFSVVQSTNGRKPTYDAANNRVTFGGDDYLTESSYGVGGATTYYLVGQMDTTQRQHFFGPSGNTTNRHMLGNQNGNFTTWQTNANGTSRTVAGLTSNELIVAVAFSSGSGGFLFMDGTDLGINADTKQVTASTLQIGTVLNRQSEGLNGFIKEIVAVSGASSTADRERMEGYLAHKHGLAANLPAAHPYKSAAP